MKTKKDFTTFIIERVNKSNNLDNLKNLNNLKNDILSKIDFMKGLIISSKKEVKEGRLNKKIFMEMYKIINNGIQEYEIKKERIQEEINGIIFRLNN